jgi:RHS repeat-associated protein
MKRYYFLPVALLFVSPAFAQGTATGFPPYGSFELGKFDAVNRQNLNVNFAIPIVSIPGRGSNFNFSIVYDSLVWTNSGGYWLSLQPSNWGWKTRLPIGALPYTHSHTSTLHRCGVDHYDYKETDYWSNYGYVDPAGTVHAFTVSYKSIYDYCSNTTATSGTPTGYATDGSGYYINIGNQNQDAPVVLSRAGIQITSNSLTDTNGNFISQVVVSGTETDWRDTANHTALRIVTNGSNVEYHYLDTTNTDQKFTLRYQNYSIKTNFGCSGVVEYNQSGTLPQVSLPYELDLPNGRTYSFSYEPTPGSTGFYTGRLQQITLPTGGTIQYTYPTAPNYGVNCTDGSIVNLSRAASDGTSTSTWQYVRAPSGSNWITTVTAPQLPYDTAANQTIYTFNSSGQELARQIYQGSSSLLRTINTTWAANGSPATRTTILEDGSTQSQTETTFDSFGNPQSLNEHDWGTGAPGVVVRTTITSYLNTSAYTARNILNRPTNITVTDGSGAVQARTDITYDETSYINQLCPAGAAQHLDSTYGCSFTTRGLPTTVTTYANAAAPSGAISRHTTYDWFGNAIRADVNCCQQEQITFSATTQYAFPDSVARGLPGGPQLTRNATYNPYTGLVALSTDENSKVTTFTYSDPGHLNRLTDVQRPDGNHISYSYNDTAKTVTVTTPIDGSYSPVQTTAYDSLGRSITATVQDGSNNTYAIVQIQYDSLGRAYKASNPYTASAQYWTTSQFDALGRPTKTILPDNAQTTYSYATNTATVTDPSGKSRKTQVDGLGRMTGIFEPDVTNGNQLTQQTTYAYSVLDALTKVTQQAQTRTYNYDSMGRLTSSTTPEAGTVCFGTLSGSTCQANGYDQYNNLLYRTDARGVITTYNYDTLNRPTQVSYNVGSTGVPATPSVNFTYGTSASQNNNGRLITMTDGPGSENYAYDLLGRETQLQKVINGTTYTTSYGYNLASELTSITYPSGRVVKPSYDAVGRLAALADTMGSTNTTYASGLAYNVAQGVTGLTYGNGVAASFSYSPDRLQLTGRSYTKGGLTLFGLSYSYAPSGGNNGQIASITDNVDNGRSVSYVYDALGRITNATTVGSTGYPKWGLSWTYDRYGNRTVQSISAGCVAPMTCPTNSVSIDVNTNRISGSPYSYDLNGNMSNEGQNTVTYDAENRAVTSSGSLGSGTYTYDGNGLRVKKAAGGAAAVYVFLGTQVIAEYDNGAPPGSPTREYIYLGGARLAKIDSGGAKYYIQDHLSARMATDSSGNKIGEQGHYPYGETWYAVNVTAKWQFTTYERDAESGNDYAMARTYVSRLGRFSSPDPLAGSIGDPQSLNRYPYSRDEPVSMMDPSGFMPCAVLENRKPGGPEAVPGGGIEDAGLSPSPEPPPGGCNGGGGGGGDCLILLDGGDVPCGIFGGLGESASVCPNNDCSALNQPVIGTDQNPYWRTPGVNGWQWTDSSGNEVAPNFYGDLGLFAGLDMPWLGSGDPFHEVAGSGGGGGGLFDTRLAQLSKLVLLDRDCLAFLSAKGIDPLQTIDALIDYNTVGLAFLPATLNKGNNSIAVIDAQTGLPGAPNLAIAVNVIGAYFHSSIAGRSLSEDKGRFAGGTEGAQLFTLLHEVGHLTNALVPDYNNQKKVDENNAALNKHCKGAISQF